MPRSHALLVWLSLSPACIAGDDDLDSSESAVIVPNCDRQGDFVVEIGEGQDGFEPIAADGEPTLWFGAQGGMHLILAARLFTPDPLDQYQITLLAEAGQEPCASGECASYTTIGQTAPVVEGASRIHRVGVGELEIPSLFLIVESWSVAPVRRLTIEISDACDRRATAVRTFVANP